MEQDLASGTCLLTSRVLAGFPGLSVVQGLESVMMASQLSTAERGGRRLCFDKSVCPGHLEQDCWKGSYPRSLWKAPG